MQNKVKYLSKLVKYYTFCEMLIRMLEIKA